MGVKPNTDKDLCHPLESLLLLLLPPPPPRLGYSTSRLQTMLQVSDYAGSGSISMASRVYPVCMCVNVQVIDKTKVMTVF